MKKAWFFAVIILGWVMLSSISFGYDWSTNPGDGSPENPYQISEPNHLMSIGSNPALLDKHFILTNDIIFDPNNNSSHIFNRALIAPDTDDTTLGFQGTTFTGIFDGKNHRILNLRFECGTNVRYIGLVGYLETSGSDSAIVKNTTLADPDLIGKSNYYTAFFVGFLDQSTIENCVIKNGFYQNHIGGVFAGENNNGSIHRCHAEATIEGSTFTGGFVGKNSGTITNSSFNGQIAGSEHVGGIAGGNAGTISRCFVICKILSNGAAKGGIAGDNSGAINNCYTQGSISGNSILGGIVGFNSIGVGGSISSCFSTCEITGTSDIGGIVGKIANGTAVKCYFLETAGPDNGYGIPLDDPNMMIRSNFAGWDFTNETVNGTNDYWRMCVNNVDYPRLNWESIDGDFACPDGVAIEDLDHFVGRWLLNNCTSSNNYCGGGDMDISGDVDLGDWVIFAQHWLEM